MSRRLPTGTKREILDLLVREELSARQMAERLDVSATAVRQHLAALLAARLVEREKGAPRAARPTYVYRLSGLGRRAYPKRYDLLVAGIVKVLIERRGRDEALAIVADAATRLAAKAAIRLPAGEDGWDALFAWLEEEFAWEADDRREGGERRLVVHQCPFREVSLDHPAICGTFFQRLIGELTGQPVEHEPIREGTRCCAFRVGVGPPGGGAD